MGKTGIIVRREFNERVRNRSRHLPAEFTDGGPRVSALALVRE